MAKSEVARNKKKEQSKRDRAKEVVTKYWKPFTIGVGTITIITVTIYVTKGRARVETAPIDKIVQNMNNLFGPWFSKQSMTIVNYTGTRGHPGFLTYWIEGQQVFDSMRTASEISGVPYYAVSEQIRGLRSDAFGQHFVRVLGY